MTKDVYPCMDCRHELDIVQVLDSLKGYAMPGQRVLVGLCPACGRSLEAVASSSRAIEVGYTYWAGSIHFEGVYRLAPAGLEVEESTAPQWVRLRFGAREWHFEAARETP